MTAAIPPTTLLKFTTFGDLLRFLRRRAGLTQLELAGAVGYSDAQISRLEQNQRLPDLPTIEACFVPALGLVNDPEVVVRLLDLAGSVRREDAPAPGLCPYKGLNYFDEIDADLFVGREAQTAELVERLLALAESGNVRFLAVVGTSGSGKSSLVRAGLVPALRWHKSSADWDIHVLTPTAHPLQNLVETLTDGSLSLTAMTELVDDMEKESRSLQLLARRQIGSRGRLLLVVDQFEELFALCRSEEQRAAFIDNLLAAASELDGPVLVVTTLRADFYAHCGQYGDLRRALAANQQYIGAMSDRELRRMIEESAVRGRWEFESGLIDLLLRDAGQEPGALPLLSHALFETWQRRRGRMMTFSGYAACYGVRGAIAETAETLFTDQFTPEQRAIARRIFLRLTEPGDDSTTADTRRRATITELILKPEETESTHAVLKALADARLITTGEDTAEVAHEALIREWPTLRGWLEENREELRLHRKLTDAAQAWQAADRAQDMLFRGVRLAQAREWAAAHDEEMNTLEADFLAESIAESELEASEREAQRRRELEAARRLAEAEAARAEEQARASGLLRRRARYLAGALITALILALVTLFFWREARQMAVLAQANEQVTFARGLAAAALSNLNVDPERSILLALQAIDVTSSAEGGRILPEAETALHQAVQASHLERSWDAGPYAIRAVEYSPDGRLLATADQEGGIKIWTADGAGPELLHTFQVQSAVTSLAFDAAGERLAAGGIDSVQIWDAATGKLLHTLTGHKGPVMDLVFSLDGQNLVTGSSDGTAVLWDASGGMKLEVLEGTGHPIVKVVFKPQASNKGIATITKEPFGSLWLNFPNDENLLKVDGFDPLSVSPDGRYVAAAWSGGEIVNIWDTFQGSLTARLAGHSGGVTGVVYSQDGVHLATASLDRTARVWDVVSGKQLLTLLGHTSPILGLDFSPDGRHLATGDESGNVRIWNTGPDREVLSISSGPKIPLRGYRKYRAPLFSPDGSQLFTIVNLLEPGLGTISQVLVVDVQSGRDLRTLVNKLGMSRDTPLASLALSPDGRWLAAGYEDGDVRVVDSTTNETQLNFTVPGPITSLAFSPDSQWMAAPAAGDSVQLSQVAAGKASAPQIIPIGPPRDFSFSPDSTRLAVTTTNGLAGVWDLSREEALYSMEVPGVEAVAYGSDGQHLAISKKDGTIQMLDAANGQTLLTLSKHTGAVTDLAFSPDMKLLASAGGDGLIRLWDTESGHELLALPGGGEVAFSPDGRLIATINSANVSVPVYVLPIEELITLARSRLTRGLTEEECREFLHIEPCPSQP